MHVCQIMLVEADSAAEAIDYVKQTITYAEERYPAWSDWHGGFDEDNFAGRWSGLFDGWEENRNVLCYTENKELAEDVISNWLGSRVEEMKRLLDRTKGLDLAEAIANYEPNGEYKYTDTNLQIWSLKSLASLLNDSWTPDTGVYDLVAHTASLSFFRERLDKEPNKQYLVPIDFHF